MLQCVAVCCSALLCVADLLNVMALCSVLQCVGSVLQCAAVFCSVLQCVAVCCRSAQRHCAVLQCAAVCCSVLQCATVCRSVLQCVAVCGHVLQFRFTSWHCTATPSFSRTYSCTCLFFVYRDLFLISEVMSISLRPTHDLYRYALSLMETGRCLSLSDILMTSESDILMTSDSLMETGRCLKLCNRKRDMQTPFGSTHQISLFRLHIFFPS